MKRFIKRLYALAILCLVVSLFLNAGSVCAQVSDSLKGELRRISTTLYHNGNDQYFIADAICDELLQPGTSYRIDYAHGYLCLNGKAVPEEYLRKYLSFYAENYRQVDCRRITRGGAQLSELFDSGFVAKKGGFYADFIGIGGQGNLTMEQQNKIFKHLKSMMVEDKLIDTNFYYDVRFTQWALYINGGSVNSEEAVNPKIAAKYAAALKADGFDIEKTNASLMYNNNYKKAH
jgi:hypothetical protein